MDKRSYILAIVAVAGTAAGAFLAGRHASEGSKIEHRAGHPGGTVASRLQPGDSAKLTPEQLAPVLESLINILDEEIAERRILAEQLEQLRSEMADFQQNLGTHVRQVFAEGERDPSAVEAREARARFVNEPNQSMEMRLAAAGFTPQQAESLRRRQAEAQMLQIEMDDRARREGWVNSPRYFEELEKLEGGGDLVRKELGDDAYDRYLFALGQPNALRIASVIETSAAEQAGLQPGDVLVRYGSERVFSVDQLVRLRSDGDRGAPVTVEIMRGGESMTLTMPRGPLGIQPSPDSIDPNVFGGG